jgi:hypothetical protein
LVFENNMSESPKPPWETAALELGKLDYSLDFGKRCEIIQAAAEAYAAEQTAALRAENAALKRDVADSEIIFGKSWLQSVRRVNGLPDLEAFHLNQVTKLAGDVAVLEEKNAALAASVSRLREALADLLGAHVWGNHGWTESGHLAICSKGFDDPAQCPVCGNTVRAKRALEAAPPPALAPDAAAEMEANPASGV